MDFEEQFITGQEIEVGNNDEGFQGSWYAAKVVQTPLTKKKKLLVEYMTLMDDVQSSKPLQEYVDTYIVRPRPPQEEERFFELGELVEAFHNDGWWEGTITHVHDDLKYRVNLKGSIEELEFQQSEIRSHHQWVGGRWVGAQERVQSGEAGRTEQIIDMASRWGEDAAKDVAVEKSPRQVQSVETDQNIGMASSWGEDAAKNVAIEKSPGQVQSVETDQNIDMASQYGKDATKDVAVENSPGQAQQHAGNQSNPSKLGSPGRRQSLQAESIDQTIDMAVTPSGNPAKTVVSKKSPSSRNSRIVDNETTPDKVSAASYTKKCCKKRKMQSTSEGDSESLNSSKNKKIQSTSASDISGIISSKKRMKVQSIPASDTVTSRTCEKLKTVEAVKTPVAPIACRGRGMATRVLTEADGRYDFTTQTTEGQGAKVKDKSSLENVEVKRVESLTLAEMFLNCSEEGYKDHPKDLISGQEQLKHVLESNGSRNQSSVEDSSHLPPNIIDVEQYEVVDLPKTQVPARPMKLRVRPLRPKGEPLAGDDIKQQTSNVSNRKTRAKVSITKDLVKDVEHNGTIGRLQAPITSREAQSKGPQQTTPCKEISNVVQIQREDATRETDMDGESSNIGDLHQLSSSSMCLWNSDVAQIVDENGVSSDNQPTAPSLKAITGKDSPANTLLDQAIGDEVSEHIQQSFLISSSTNQLLLEDEKFPFIKCSPVWKAVESLEVFHTMPQKLHFHPLEQLDMNLREGHAIGSMVNFANIVEQVGKMKHDDPLSILQESSKALENFEAYGFNVQPIQARIGTLLRIKEEQAKLNDELMEAEDHINMEVGLKISIIAELDEHNQKTRELQECLNQVIKKRELAVLKKEVQDAKIAELEKTMVIVRECIRSVTSEFRTVVATPWIHKVFSERIQLQSIEDPELVVASSGGAEGNERVTMAAELSPSPSTQLPAAAAGTPTSTADVALLLHHFECSLYS